ncbi:MAG: hypothetical protein N3D17_01160 [bacterium]|nr:hypothetical protein [bacterium]
MEKTPLWEDVIIIISIFTLWPTILHRETLLSKIIMVLTLTILIWILIRRLKRMDNITK